MSLVQRIGLILAIYLLATPAPATDLAELLAPVLAEVPTGGQLGVVVLRSADGSVLAAHRAHDQLQMASLTKLPVSAAALLSLGPDYNFRTQLIGLGPVVDGVLPGLGVIGGGSPCLDEHFTDGDPDRIFQDWARSLRDSGITRIAGDLVVDGSMFSGPIRPDTYPNDHANAQRWYSAPASAFAWNDNCIEVRVVPGPPGQAARIELRPESDRIEIVNRTRSVASGGDRNLTVMRAHHADRIQVSGRYHRSTAWFPLAIHADPDLMAMDHMRAVFLRSGLPVEGEVRRGVVAGGPLLLQHSDPLVPALRILNQRSQNFYGEQILRVLGHQHSGEGSITAGCAAVTEILTQHLDLRSFALLDGSGLSYENRGSAMDIAMLLARMRQGPHGDTFVGTLRERWSGRQRGLVKTGSLAVARCLAGYLPAEGHPQGWAFAIIINRGDSRNIAWANTLRDRLFATIAAAGQRKHSELP